jgi:transcriptional regulator with XRE-family HTH domain
MNQIVETCVQTRRIPPRVIDVHLGMRLRVLRRAAGMTQNELADQVGVTFQQIQKYETAKNRISAATLHALCRALRTQPTAMFEGLEAELPSQGAGPSFAGRITADARP